MAVDPEASLGIRSTFVRLGELEREYEVQGHSAADWLSLILAGQLYKVIPGWIVDDDEDIFQGILSGDITDDQLEEAMHDVMTLAGGRVWWWTAQLVLSAAADNKAWSQLHGQLVMHGVRAEEIPFAAWIDAMYSVMVTGFTDSESRQKFDQAMDTPPASIPLDEEEEANTFFALMNASM